MNTTALSAIKGNQSVTTVRWLLRREFWEHKGSMFWAPVVVAALLVVLLAGALAFGVSRQGLPDQIWIDGQAIPLQALTDNLHDNTKAYVAAFVTGNYLIFTLPVLAILAIASFFYCLGALYDERRDRSILFWKSLPVSDPMTVLSKAATTLLLAPAIAMGVVAVSSLAILMLVCLTFAAMGVNIIPAVLAAPNLYLSPLYLLALLPVYAIWALPTAGWLLLVSSWARTKPFLWAVGAPLTALFIVKWISLALGAFGELEYGLAHTANGIVARLLGGLVPGIWFTFDGQSLPGGRMAISQGMLLGDIVTYSWRSLASIDAWTGAVAGVAMLFGAARLRRWRDEG